MQKLLFLFLVIPIVVLGQEEKIINVKDITEVNGTFFFKHDTTLDSGKAHMKLVTGKVIEKYENGQLKKEGTFKNGKEEGLYKEWHENGFLSSEGTWKEGNKVGLWKRWHENGQLESEITFTNGKIMDAVIKGWYENGKLKMEGIIKNDELDGLSKEWYENGKLKTEGTIKNGKPEGFMKRWHENGQLWIEATYKDGNLEGLYREWYANGQLRNESVNKNGKQNGAFRFWHENGQLNGEAIFKDGKQVGTGKVWNKDGKLIEDALPQTTKCYVEGETPILVNKFNYLGHHYQYIKKHMSWDDAKQLAEKEGGYLAIFETLEEMNHVIAANAEKSTYWIGLNDYQKEGNWMWINGMALNKNMEGYLESGNDLKNRDYGHIMMHGGFMSRHISGGLPKGWNGEMCVSGYIIEFDFIK